MLKSKILISTYRPDIDGLRAVAILSVLAFHAFPHLVPGGFVGVDVFFVISGYLIGGMVLDALGSGWFNLVDFYSRRIKRIFPPLIVVLAAVYVAGWNLLLTDEFKLLGRDIAAGAAFVSNLVSWSEAGYFDRAAETKPLLHLWSLGIEEQFYIFWPLILYVAYRKAKFILPVLLALAAASFVFSLHATATDPGGAFYSPLSRCWELASGTILAQWTRSRHSGDEPGAVATRRGEVLSNFLGATGFALIVAACLILDSTARFPGAWATLPVAGALLVMRAGSAAWLNRVILASKPAVFVGTTSYAIYLWHWPLLAFLRISSGGQAGAWARCAVIGASMLLAWLSYRLLESPIRAPGHNRRKVSLLCCTLAITGAIGLLTYRAEGVPSRYPPLIQQLTDVGFSIPNEARENACFMSPEQDESKFATECLEHVRPLIFLWGDSHAGSIYPGLKAVQRDYRFGIAQYTASACPPLLGITIPERPNCRHINDYVVAQVRANRPEVVFLDANWNFANHPLWHAAYNLKLLDGTVAALKDAGARRIVILGSAPAWQDSLPRMILQSWRNDPLRRAPPLRLESGKRAQSVENDRTMKQIADRLGVEFVSVYDILCDEKGCLTRLSQGGHEITASDMEHLTPRAADYVMQKIFERGAFAEPR